MKWVNKGWAMVGLVGMLAATTSMAGGTQFPQVPEPLGSYLGAHQVKQARMNDGVLHVVLEKAELSSLAYYTFIYHGICAEQWRKPAAFGKMGLKRVEVFEASGQRGWAFDGDANVCAEMGNMGKNFGSFIQKYSAPCTAGQCIQRP